jgi:hypothetical protein
MTLPGIGLLKAPVRHLLATRQGRRHAAVGNGSLVKRRGRLLRGRDLFYEAQRLETMGRNGTLTGTAATCVELEQQLTRLLQVMAELPAAEPVGAAPRSLGSRFGAPVTLCESGQPCADLAQLAQSGIRTRMVRVACRAPG